MTGSDSTASDTNGSKCVENGNKKGIYNCNRATLWKDHAEVMDKEINIIKINLKETKMHEVILVQEKVHWYISAVVKKDLMVHNTRAG
jgi:hypothetical protein